MELSIPRYSDGYEFSWATIRLKNTDGLSIGKTRDNLILTTRIYVVKYPDGHKASLAENAIAENIFEKS